MMQNMNVTIESVHGLRETVIVGPSGIQPAVAHSQKGQAEPTQQANLANTDAEVAENRVSPPAK